MLTRAIFILPDSELIRERVWACAKLFVVEGNVHMAHVESWKNKNIDGFYTKTTQKEGFSKLCVKIEKRCYTDLLHFSTRKHNLVSFFVVFCIFFFFSKKYNQVNSSVVNNMQYTLFTIFPLSGPLQSLCLFLLISSRISDFKCHSF